MSDSSTRRNHIPAGAGEAGDVPVVPAATVMLLRGSPLEVLLVRRHQKSSFVPDTWVFPGGSVDEDDALSASRLGASSTLRIMQVAAIRELFEETGIWMGGPLADPVETRALLRSGALNFPQLDLSSIDFDALVWTSRWITPVTIPKRFDTWFFLAAAPPSASAIADASEITEVLWITPEEALRREELQMVFPQIRNLEAISGFASIDELLAARRGADIQPVLPRVVVEDGRKKIVLP